MGAFLRFIAFFALLVAAFVLVGLPLILSPLLTTQVREAGLTAETVNVNVALFDPTLLLGRSRQVTLDATDVSVAPAEIGRLHLAIGNADYFERSFQTVSGELDDLTVSVKGADTIHVQSMTLDGPATAASATAHLSAVDTDHLIKYAASRAGINVAEVSIGDNGVTVSVAGHEASARLSVAGGALVLDPGVGGSIVLLQPSPSDPWTLEEAWTSADGLNVRATVNVARLTSGMLSAT